MILRRWQYGQWGHRNTKLKAFKTFVMVNFKKMDEKDFVFINKPLNEKEEKEFSDFLKKKKLKTKSKMSKTSGKQKVLA